MATVTATYAPAAGRQAVTLTSWAGSAAFATTPTAGSQIEGSDDLTIGDDGVITGPDGTYAIHHITTAGVIEADSFAITTPDTTAPIISTLTAAGTDPDSIAVSVNTNEDNGGVYYFASGNATEDKPTIRAGAQGITTVTETGAQPLTLTLATGTYRIHALHEDDAGNQSNLLVSSAIILESVNPAIDTLTAVGTDPDTIEVAFNTDKNNGVAHFFASASATETESAIISGAQKSPVVTATGTQSDTLTLSPGAWYVHALHEDAAGDQSNILSSAEVVLALIPEVGTGTATYSPPANMSLATLAGPIDGYLAVDFVSPPEAGEQVLTLTADGAFDSGLNWSGDAEGAFPYWYINNAGAIFERTITTGSLQSLPDENVVIDSVEATRTTITVNFSYSGVDAESFEARLDDGTWATTSSPATFTDLTSATEYVVAVRPVSAAGAPGIPTTQTVTTSPAVDITPSPFSFPALVNVARSVPQVSASVTIQGVDAATDVPVTVTGGEYSVSTDNGATYGGWTSAGTNVRLNHRIRLRHTSSDEYSSGGYNGVRTTTLSVPGADRSFITTTLADTTAPVITLTDGNVTHTQGQPWVERGYSAIDAADGDISVSGVVINGTIDVDALGPQSLEYVATDQSLNVARTTRTVTVVVAIPDDQVKPVITLDGGNITLNAGESWIEPGFTAFDAVDGILTGSVSVTGAVNTSVPGPYTVTYTVSDQAGNTATATRTVTVVSVVVYPFDSPAPTRRTVIADRFTLYQPPMKIMILQPGEVLDFDYDLTNWLATEGDQIVSGSHQTMELSSSLTILDSGAVTGTSRIKVWMQADDVNEAESSLVQLTITTTGARQAVFQFRVLIINRMQ